MGKDIHMYMEYRSRKKKRYMYGGKFDNERLYGIFFFFSDVFYDVKPLYPARGLPGNVTRVVYEEYKREECEAHHASWLTADELRECIDLAAARYSRDGDDSWLKPYELIYSYLKDSDDAGEPSRVVFWFDN